MDLAEHLIDVLEPGARPVEPVVSGVSLLARGQEGMPLAVGVPERHPGVRVAAVEGLTRVLEELSEVRHG